MLQRRSINQRTHQEEERKKYIERVAGREGKREREREGE
jgi:hypothetical protein